MLHPRRNFSWSGKECEPISSLLDPDTFQILLLPSLCFTTTAIHAYLKLSCFCLEQSGSWLEHLQTEVLCLLATFDLLNKATANAFNKQGDHLQIWAAMTCQAAASVPSTTFVLVWQEELPKWWNTPTGAIIYRPNYLMKALLLSSEGKRCCLNASLDLRQMQLLRLNLSCLVWSPDRSWSLF